MADLPTQIQSTLRIQSLPVPSIPWLRSIIPPRNPPPPLASLIATARTRLLASDLTTPGLLDLSYTQTNCLPSQSINNPEIDNGRLEGDIVLQILDIENLSRSRWEQVEELEAIERGEMTRGREVVRLPVEEDDNDRNENQNDGPPPPPAATAAGGAAGSGAGAGSGSGVGAKATHRLVLQDCRGEKVFALELKRIERFGVGTTNIGEKLSVRKDTRIARGVLLLEPANCVPLGGRVEAWHKAWVDGRLARLKEAIGADR